jgi:hypothetical protein
VTDPTSEPTALTIALETDRATYAPGDSIRAQLTVSHGGGSAVVLEFGSSQRCDFAIQDAAGTTVWRWSADRAFAQMMGEVTVAPGRPPLVCTEPLVAPPVPGRYRIEGTLTAIEHRMTATVNVTVATAISRPR